MLRDHEYDDCDCDGEQEEKSVNPTSALLMCELFGTVGMCLAVTVSGTMFLDRVAVGLGGQSFNSADGMTTQTAWARIPEDRFRSTCTASLEFLWLVLTGVASLGGVSSVFTRAVG